MYDALQIAQYVVNQSIRGNRSITNLKLQKLLYYIQAAFLERYGEVCYKNKITKRRHGAIVEEVYEEYRKYIDEPIKESKGVFIRLGVTIGTNVLTMEKIEYKEECLLKEHRELIDEILDSYATSDPWEMVEKMLEETPVIDTEEGAEITAEKIRWYYRKNPEKIYGEEIYKIKRGRLMRVIQKYKKGITKKLKVEKKVNPRRVRKDSSCGIK